MSLVHPASDPGREAVGAQDYVEVTMTLADGRCLARRVSHVRGDPRGGEPLSLAELHAKYVANAATVLDRESVRRSAEMLMAIDRVADVASLTATLRQ
jgi:hypothetical protein